VRVDLIDWRNFHRRVGPEQVERTGLREAVNLTEVRKA
jgi:hypothetical protein